MTFAGIVACQVGTAGGTWRRADALSNPARHPPLIRLKEASMAVAVADRTSVTAEPEAVQATGEAIVEARAVEKRYDTGHSRSTRCAT